MTEARGRTIIIYEIQETGVLKKYWLRKKINILNLPSKKKGKEGALFLPYPMMKLAITLYFNHLLNLISRYQ